MHSIVCGCTNVVSLNFLQLYDQVQSSEIVLYNTGKVGMEFCVMGATSSSNRDLAPGEVSVTPLMVSATAAVISEEIL